MRRRSLRLSHHQRAPPAFPRRGLSAASEPKKTASNGARRPRAETRRLAVDVEPRPSTAYEKGEASRRRGAAQQRHCTPALVGDLARGSRSSAARSRRRGVVPEQTATRGSFGDSRRPHPPREGVVHHESRAQRGDLGHQRFGVARRSSRSGTAPGEVASAAPSGAPRRRRRRPARALDRIAIAEIRKPASRRPRASPETREQALQRPCPACRRPPRICRSCSGFRSGAACVGSERIPEASHDLRSRSRSRSERGRIVFPVGACGWRSRAAHAARASISGESQPCLRRKSSSPRAGSPLQEMHRARRTCAGTGTCTSRGGAPIPRYTPW